MRSTRMDIAAAGGLRFISSTNEDIALADDEDRHLLEARDDERRQIARDLHNVTAQLLLELEFALNTIESADETAKSKARVSALDAIAKLQGQVRCVSYLLHPPELTRFGLEKTLEALTLGMSERCGIDIRFRSHGYRQGIPGVTEMSMLRIAQEALMNIFKHSQSDRADFYLRCTRDWIFMRIRDFGIGRKAGKPLTPGEGVGLSGMQARMAAIGGSLNIRALDEGTVVTAVAPISSIAESCLESAWLCGPRRVFRVQ